MGLLPPARRALPARALSLAAAAGCLLLPASAQAATAGVSGGVLKVTAAPGEANAITVSSSAGSFVVRDDGAPLSALLGCTSSGAAQAGCGSSGVNRIEIDAGDGDDAVSVTTWTSARIWGGPGSDTLSGGRGGDTFLDGGGPGADVLIGGAGRDTADYSARSEPVALSNDSAPGDGQAGEGDDIRSDVERLQGGAGADLLIGGPGADDLRGNGGADTFRASPGADAMAGGGGVDHADYSDRGEPLAIDADGQADDGAAGEGDNVGSDVEDLTGGAGPDSLTGQGGANVLRGRGGNDVLGGRDGKDSLDGGDGDDRLDGGGGDDSLEGGPGADAFSGGPGGADSLDYGARTGPVTITANGVADDGEPGEGDSIDADIERLAGGPGGDTIAAGGGASTLTGAGGDDSLTGGAANDTLDGGDGDDTLDGGGGADRLAGGAGRDSADYSRRTAAVTADADDSSDDGEAGERDRIARDVERLVGGAGPDTLEGEEGDDSLEGGPGDDVLRGEAGADFMSGGAGTDTADYGNRHEPVFVELDADADDGALREGDLVAADVESVQGGAGQDRLVGDGGPNRLRGGGGDDVLVGAGGDDELLGEGGDDQLDGGDGGDLLDGGEGVDLADYVSAATSVEVDMLHPASGSDRLVAVERLAGTLAADRLEGGTGDDELRGHGGDDSLDGRAGADRLIGDDGRDTVSYRSRTEPVTVDTDGYADDGQAGEGDQVDTTVENVTGGAGNDSLTIATAGRNVLRGRAGDDVLAAGTGDDRLIGHDGADTLDAGEGDDRLHGGPGADMLEPGAGADVVYAGEGSDEIDSRDGERDYVNCGAGRDSYRADPIDRMVACERRRRPPPAATPEPDRVTGARVVRKRGRFVPIPGFPGERIDSRLLRDIRWMRAKFRIRVTDGYALRGHARNGEHPIGLAVDIVPGPGGSWRDVDRLARWAEPRQNRPRAPFRWVGYDGDRNHGRGHHLHLSWMHGPARRGRPAPWVYVIDFARGERARPAARPTPPALRARPAALARVRPRI